MKNLSKNLVLLITIVAFQFSNAQNDKGFYLGLNAGFGANIGGTTNLATSFGLYNSNEIAPGVESIEIEKLGLGKGLNAGILAGYMFNKNIGVELGINYLSGSKSEFTQSSISGETSISEVRGKMVQFRPTLVLAAGMNKINPYAKFGLTLGKPKGELNTNYNDPANAIVVETETELTGKMALGLHGGIGLNYALNSKISLFGELIYTGLTFRPTNAKVTKAIANGVNTLPLLDVSDKEIEFVSDFVTNAPSNSNLPTRQPAFDIPFNNIALQFGIKYGF